MSRVAWTLKDPMTLEVYTFPQNPNQMSAGRPRRTFDSGSGFDGKPRVISSRVPIDWTFAGTLRTQGQHNAFVNWFNRAYPIVITDHFAVKRVAIPLQFEPQDKRDARNPWLHTYTFKGRLIDTDLLSSVDQGWLA